LPANSRSGVSEPMAVEIRLDSFPLVLPNFIFAKQILGGRKPVRQTDYKRPP
jgi:hypothetical protein